MEEQSSRSQASRLLDFVLEVSHALATLNAARLEEVGVLYHNLTSGQTPRLSVSAKRAISRELATLRLILEGTRDNLRVLQNMTGVSTRIEYASTLQDQRSQGRPWEQLTLHSR